MPAGAIGRRAPLEHKAFDSELAALLATRREVIPVSSFHDLRRTEHAAGVCTGRCDHLLEQLASRTKIKRTYIAPFELQKVIDLKDHRDLGEYLWRKVLSPYPPLQFGEGQDTIILPRQDLAIENGPVGKLVCGIGDLRKTIGDQVLATRPYKYLALAFYHLGADPVPLPFSLPVRDIAQLVRRRVDLMREMKRIGPGDRAGVGIGARIQ